MVKENPMIDRIADPFPRICLMKREWRYAVYTSQVTSAHVSLGSQLQYLPQAYFAQMAPKMRAPAVNMGYPIPTAV
jgi:hypothetical protein